MNHPRQFAQLARRRALRNGSTNREARLAYLRAYRQASDRNEKRKRGTLKRQRLERMLMGFGILKGRLARLNARLRRAMVAVHAQDRRSRGPFAGTPRSWLER